MSEPLLIEIGCEEIPARMIAGAAADLAARLVAILAQAGVAHGPARHWGGTRRLAVAVAGVRGQLEDKVERVLGPPAAAAFAADGRLTPAGAGFARKQGVDPGTLTRIETDKGVYAGFTRKVGGRSLAQVLAAALPQAVASMSFPKTMRWGTGEHRWVRPVHWVVALHGGEILDVEILGARAGCASRGHRFLAPGPVTIPAASAYVEILRGVKVLVDPAERREALKRALDAAAALGGGAVVPDEGLLDEVTDLVEWPGVVTGRFDSTFLELPREILIATLRHHQKSFSVEARGALLPAFLSVANTDRDPAGHVRRGNEWVVVGRLEDARFFWSEDRKRTLASRVPDLSKITFHKALGSYGEKAERMAALCRAASRLLSSSAGEEGLAVEAALLAKADLSTGLVGEFPELQGIVGGLLLRAEGGSPALADAVADHYRPASPEDAVPRTELGCVVSLADRLDTIAGLLRAGEAPTGSRDPFGLRRAASGVFRIAAERRWPVGIAALHQLSDRVDAVYVFLRERLERWLIDQGFTPLEVAAVQKPRTNGTEFDTWSIAEILDRLRFLKTVRGSSEFGRLVDLTKRVDNICAQARTAIDAAISEGFEPRGFEELEPAARELETFHAQASAEIRNASQARRFEDVVASLATYVDPIAAFFERVLVLDPKNLDATLARTGLLEKVGATLTHDFDIRELAGQADAKH